MFHWVYGQLQDVGNRIGNEEPGGPDPDPTPPSHIHDHRNLVGREFANAHFIRSITDLEPWILNLVVAAYGGIRLSAPVALPDIGAGWQTLPADELTVTVPRFVTPDLATDSLSLDKDSVWQVSIFFSITHNEAQGSRNFQIRLFNLDTGLGGAATIIGVGRNTDVTTFAFNTITETATNGDRLVIQIGNGSAISAVTLDSYTFNVVNIGHATSLVDL